MNDRLNIKTEADILKEIIEAEKQSNKCEQLLRDTQKALDIASSNRGKPKFKLTERKYPDTNKIKKPIDWIRVMMPFGIVMLSIFVLSLIGNGVLAAIVVFLGLIPSLLYIPYYLIFKQNQINKDYQQKILNSVEYQAQCVKLDAQYDMEDEKIKAKFNSDMEKFRANQVKEVNALTEKLKDIKSESNMLSKKRDTLICQYGKIPSKYVHNIDALDYMYEVMSDKNVTLNEAVLLYEEELKARAERERIREAQRFEEELRRIEEQEARIQEERYRYYEERDNSGSFIKDVAASAIGGAIANHGIKKELERQRKAEEEREKSRKADEDMKRWKEVVNHNFERQNIIQMNKDRARKGLPPLPVPSEWFT